MNTFESKMDHDMLKRRSYGLDLPHPSVDDLLFLCLTGMPVHVIAADDIVTGHLSAL